MSTIAWLSLCHQFAYLLNTFIEGNLCLAHSFHRLLKGALLHGFAPFSRMRTCLLHEQSWMRPQVRHIRAFSWYHINSVNTVCTAEIFSNYESGAENNSSWFEDISK